jgi:hypothetical protein
MARRRPYLPVAEPQTTVHTVIDPIFTFAQWPMLEEFRLIVQLARFGGQSQR